MKTNSHPSLTLAHALLPHVREKQGLGIVIGILTWLKVCSTHWQANGGALMMTPNCTFDTFLHVKGADTARAIQNAIDELVRLNPALEGVLQPGLFEMVQQLYVQDQAHPDALHKLVTIINQIDFKSSAHSLACGAEFTAVIAAVCHDNNRHARAFASLCAKLLKPKAGEAVLDPACGHAILLLACARELAEQSAPESVSESAPLHLHGLTHHVSHWSAAKMQLSLSGLPHEHIYHANPLLIPLTKLTAPQKALALRGANIVVMAVPEANWDWCGRQASCQQDPRLQGSMTSDSRLLLVLQALAALNPENGRMALVMPTHVLSIDGGDTLRHHLVENNLLDAVICLPDIPEQMLLMIRTQRSQTKIAFIHAQGSGAAGMASALQAYQRYQAGQTDPALFCLAQSTVAANHYRLSLPMVGAAVSASNGPPLDLVFPS